MMPPHVWHYNCQNFQEELLAAVAELGDNLFFCLITFLELPDSTNSGWFTLKATNNDSASPRRVKPAKKPQHIF